MTLDIRLEKGVPLDRQVFTWRELGGPPYSKLDDDAFCVEAEAVLTQALVIMLTAEAADSEGWTLLVELTEGMGFDDLAAQFRAALVDEEEHVAQVRHWLATSVLGQSGVAPAAGSSAEGERLR